MSVEELEKEPNWALVLRAFHNAEKAEEDQDDIYSFVNDNIKSDLEHDDIDDALDYLNNVSLVRRLGEDAYKLKPDGFSTCHERIIRKQQARREKQQNRITHAIVFLTLGLVLTNAVIIAQEAAVAGWETYSGLRWTSGLVNWPNFWSGIGIAIVGVMIYLLWENDLLL